MTENILVIRNLHSKNNDEYFVEDINLELKKGEIHALIGENGSGKNTFFKAVSGEIPNTTGEFIYKDKSITASPSFKGIEGTSYIQRYPDLIEDISVAENIFLFTYNKKRFFSILNWKDMYKKTEKIIARYGLEIDPRKKVAKLSQEEKKIVELAKFHLQDNRLAIYYEPTDDISVNIISNFYKILADYKNKGRSILIITKQWEEALKVADRISVMSSGKIVGTLSANTAKEDPHKLLNMLMGKPRYKHENNQVMDTIFKAAEFLTSEYELKDVLSFIAKQAAEIMNAQQCVLDLIDEKTNTVIDQVSYDLGSGLSGSIKRDRFLQLFNNNNNKLFYITKGDKNFFNFFEDVGDIKTLICLPVLIRSRITGFIQLFYRDYYPYKEDESIYLSTLARQAAIAIEDTRLMGRSALLMESHHRIKNNLQSVVSLINLQKDFINKEGQRDVRDILDNIISRISSIAFVHDLLSKDEYGRSILNVKKLINIIADFYNIESRVELKLDIDNIFISYNKATAIALIINELINNCFEHAFPEGRNGFIKIKCKQGDEKIILEVLDNGRGLPVDFDLNKVDSLGLSIVRAIIINEFSGEMVLKKNKTIPGSQVLITLSTEKCLI